MTNAIISAVKTGIEAAGGLPWQVQVGEAAGMFVLTVLGGIVGWFAHKKKVSKK